MKTILLHHLGVPCISSVAEQGSSSKRESGKVYLNPEAIIRYEPGGAVIIPPMLYSSFLYADKELANLLKKRSFEAGEISYNTFSLLSENEVISREREKKNIPYKEFSVDVDDLPIQCLLEVTSTCDCQCASCYHASSLEGYRPSLKVLERMVAQLKHLGLGLFEVTGGEPFLRNDLGDVLEYIYSQGLQFYVVTNGSLLAKANTSLIKTLKKGLGLAVSLDGVDEIHDRIRNHPGLFKKLLAGLDLASENGIKPYLISTLNRLNVSCVEKMIAIAERYNTTLHLRPSVRTGNALKNALADIDLRLFLKPFLNHPNVRNGLISTKKVIPVARYYGCGIRKRISISPRGILYPCVMDRERPSVDIMSLDRTGLVKNLAEETKRFLDKNDKCRNCQINKTNPDDLTCGGLCRFSKSYRKEVTK